MNPSHPSRLAVPLAVVILGGLFYLAGSYLQSGYAPVEAPAEHDKTVSEISVSGEGKVYASPDIADLSFGVQTGRQATAKDALVHLSKTMASVIDAVKKAGIGEKDIQTESFWLSPAYDYTSGRQVPRGFEASQNLRVKVRDLDKIGDVLNAAAAAGSNQAGGINFTIDNPEKLQADARAKAIEQAKAKAEELAKQLGVKLKKIKGFSENTGGYYPPIMMRSMSYDAKAEGAAMPTPQVPAGQQEVTSQVTMVYEIE